MKRLFILLSLLPSVALSSERVRMSDNSSQTSLKDVLVEACGAFDAENLESFGNCFVSARREQVRRRSAMTFVRGHASMEFVESHAIDVGEEEAEAAVRYRMTDSSGSMEFVSRVKFLKEDGKWLIDRETVVSKKPCASSTASMSDPVPVRANAQRDPNWDPMKPDRGKISPHLDHLVGDIGMQPATGCELGKCPGGRCPVK